MEDSLLLEKGEIVLSDHKIMIRDKAGRNHKIQLVSAVVWFFYGIISVLRYLKTGDEFLLWSGILIGVLHFAGFIYMLFRTTVSEIPLQDIKWAAFKVRNGNQFVDLKLTSGLNRRISKIEPVADELKAYFTLINVEIR